ncbi:hypothetical protein ACRC7T_17425 (plasmid) [Segnochrobactraceae bacterium EtOH-i3]
MTEPSPFPDTKAILAALKNPHEGNALREAVNSRVGMLALRLSSAIIANRSVPTQFKIPKPTTPLDIVATHLFIEIIKKNPTNPTIILD